VCDHYGLTAEVRAKKKKVIGSNENERVVLGYLSSDPKTIDELCGMCDLDTKVIASTLMVMEMKRIVRNVGAMRYVVD